MTWLIRPATWTEMPWRNGGGTTSEIAAERQGDTIVWRISTALVERDGAYSPFPGCLRISTVIDGNGTMLRDEPSGKSLEIPPLSPTRFDGAIPWRGLLTDGPIRHLDLIYNPQRVRASVEDSLSARMVGFKPFLQALLQPATPTISRTERISRAPDPAPEVTQILALAASVTGLTASLAADAKRHGRPQTGARDAAPDVQSRRAGPPEFRNWLSTAPPPTLRCVRHPARTTIPQR